MAGDTIMNLFHFFKVELAFEGKHPITSVTIISQYYYYEILTVIGLK